jgi:hypothetical protein
MRATASIEPTIVQSNYRTNLLFCQIFQQHGDVYKTTMQAMQMHYVWFAGIKEAKKLPCRAE